MTDLTVLEFSISYFFPFFIQKIYFKLVYELFKDDGIQRHSSRDTMRVVT